MEREARNGDTLPSRIEAVSRMGTVSTYRSGENHRAGRQLEHALREEAVELRRSRTSLPAIPWQDSRLHGLHCAARRHGRGRLEFAILSAGRSESSGRLTARIRPEGGSSGRTRRRMKRARATASPVVLSGRCVLVACRGWRALSMSSHHQRPPDVRMTLSSVTRRMGSMRSRWLPQ